MEQQIELRDLYRKIKADQPDIIGKCLLFWKQKSNKIYLGFDKQDIVDRIMLDLSDKTKSRRQIIKELKNQHLIEHVKELKL